jgi:hypothetical protein
MLKMTPGRPVRFRTHAARFAPGAQGGGRSTRTRSFRLAKLTYGSFDVSGNAETARKAPRR